MHDTARTSTRRSPVALAVTAAICASACQSVIAAEEPATQLGTISVTEVEDDVRV
jgi:hypothetical protein